MGVNGIRLGRIGNAPIVLEPAALVIMLLFGATWIPQFQQYGITGGGVVAGVALVAVGMLVSILLHELGHVAAGYLFKVRTVEVRLHILGGYARFDDAPGSAAAQFVISLAGPAMNLALWWGIINFAPPISRLVLVVLNFVAYWNLFLGMLNLIPAPPLDGGHAFAGLVWMVTRRQDLALRISGVVGIIALGVFGLGSLMPQLGILPLRLSPFTVAFIALFTVPTCIQLIRTGGRAASVSAGRYQVEGARTGLNASEGEIADTLARAKTYATSLGSPTVGSVEILLAVLAYEMDPTAQAFAAGGVRLDNVWQAAVASQPPGQTVPEGGPVPSAGAHAIVAAAHKLGRGRTGLFLAIGADSPAAALVASLGLDLAAVQAQVAGTSAA